MFWLVYRPRVYWCLASLRTIRVSIGVLASSSTIHVSIGVLASSRNIHVSIGVLASLRTIDRGWYVN